MRSQLRRCHTEGSRFAQSRHLNCRQDQERRYNDLFLRCLVGTTGVSHVDFTLKIRIAKYVRAKSLAFSLFLDTSKVRPR